MKRRALTPVAALLLAACGSDAPGTVQGEMFIVTANGDQIDLLGRAVHLIPESEKFRIDSIIQPVCATRAADLAGVPTDGTPRADSLRRAALERAWGARERVLKPYVRRTVRTGQRARFVFDTVPPGDYRVWADATVDGDRWSWTPRIRLRPGDTARVDLSNGNPDEDPFRCQARIFKPPIG